jgi:hypothetical protein
MTDAALTPTRLWKSMTAAQRIAAAEAFWRDEQATDDQIQAVMLISQQKKFRPKTVVGLDVDRKARHLASIVNLPEGLAARALIVYHLAQQRPMMGTFLDALGLAHEDGLIKDDNVQPDAAKLAPAVAAIRAAYPAEDVSLYLSTLVCQDAQTWGALGPLLEPPAAQPAPAAASQQPDAHTEE